MILLLAVVAGVVAVTQAQRKVPVQHAQRAVGRKVYAGGSSFMPLRVNYSGVMPLIFAQAILMFPGMVFKRLELVRRLLCPGGGLVSTRASVLLFHLRDDDHVFRLFLGGDHVQRD